MSKSQSQSSIKPVRLTSLITRIVFATILIIILIVLLQNYRLNQQVISQEVARSTKQTSSLIQSIFNFRLKSAEIQQDSYSRNDTLLNALYKGKTGEIEQFFAGIDKINPSLTPDFRFITQKGDLVWDDTSHQFYGIKTRSLLDIGHEMSLTMNWHLTHVDSKLGWRYLMLRRTPLIDMKTGEVIGFLHIGIVLNDNFSISSLIRTGSNTDNIVLTIGSEIVASTVSKSGSYTNVDVIDSYARHNKSRDPVLVTKTDLLVNSSPTYLSVYSVQNNENIANLIRNHYLGIGTIFIVVILAVVFIHAWLKRRISLNLDKLLSYTNRAVKYRKIGHFEGSEIVEFEELGHALELTFTRLDEQEKQFEDLFNFSLLPIMFWDTSGKLLKMNPAAEHYFHSSNGNQGFNEKMLPQIAMAAQGATLTGVNLTLGNKVFRWNLSPIIIDNEIQSVVTQGQDITSLVEAEKNSELARLEAEESARVRADFLAKMSHELRTPLNGILGVSQLLKSSLSSESDLEHVDVLLTSGEHLLAVLNDILDFSKIEQGKFHIQKSEFRLIELQSSVEKIYKPLCDEKGVSLIVESNIDGQCLAFSDQVRLSQVMFNLVSNAVKFTHFGQVKVGLEYVDNQHETENGSDQLIISVEDTGIGIDNSRIDSIFEPFIQAEATTTREYGGSGLGLAIIKSLVELLNGTINVESTPNKGSCFTLSFPIEGRRASESYESENFTELSDTLFDVQLRVLIVEDNNTNAFIAQAFCRKYGMEVEWVKDGLLAIEQLKQDANFDLILMDNQLPNLGGIETTQIIREGMGLTMPIYACTADGMQDTKRAFLSAGADYVIIKPIKEKALVQAFVHFKKTAQLN